MSFSSPATIGANFQPMTTTCPACAAAPVRLDALANRIGAELAELLRMSLSVQDAIAHERAGLGEAAGTVAGLQAIDRITQGLSDLARLMSEVGYRVPDSVVINRQVLDERLILRDLAHRVLPSACGTNCAFANATSHALSNRTEPGDVLLF